MMSLVFAEEPFPKLDRVAVQGLAIPTLVTRGETSDVIHTLGAAELTRLLKRATTATIPGAGHRAPVENPEAFNRVVLGFLDSI